MKIFEPNILISLVNWMNYWDTVKCISLCKELSYPKFKIIVVDNHSPNESVNLIRDAHPDIHIICLKKNKGYAAGHFASYLYLKENGLDAMWIINPDISFKKDVLTNLVKAWEQKGDAVFGSVQTDKEFKKIIFAGRYGITSDFEVDRSISADQLYSGKPLSALPDGICPAEFVLGASFLIPLKVIQTMGFLNTSYFMYGEELDYCYRAWQHKIFSYVVASAPYVMILLGL